MMRTGPSPSMLRAAVCLALSSIALSACNSIGGAAAADKPVAAAVQPTQATKVGGGAGSPVVTITPADRASGVRLDANLRVAAQGGTLTRVILLAGDQPAGIDGAFSKAHDQWVEPGGLDSDRSYTLQATATGSNGAATTATATFHTLAAKGLDSIASPGDGATVGVGMPLKIHFNVDVPNDKKQNVIDHIAVRSSPGQNGGWFWPMDNEAHYRPEKYWLPGIDVTVLAQLRGVEAAEGTWGLANWTSRFHIGEKRVSIIDTATHTMSVYVSDQLRYSWPVSTGRPSLPTLGGTLVVLGRQQDILMDSRGIGIPIWSPDGYHEHVYWNTAISVNGFYVHAAPWSEWAQGNQNVSHGCVNLPPSSAVTFYDLSTPGDVVQVTNSPRVADYQDGEGDWQTPWQSFKPGGQAVVGGAPSPTQPPPHTS